MISIQRQKQGNQRNTFEHDATSSSHSTQTVGGSFSFLSSVKRFLLLCSLHIFFLQPRSLQQYTALQMQMPWFRQPLMWHIKEASSTQTTCCCTIGQPAIMRIGCPGYYTCIIGWSDCCNMIGQPLGYPVTQLFLLTATGYIVPAYASSLDVFKYI